jgi:excisionase family DNA binding protein
MALQETLSPHGSAMSAPAGVKPLAVRIEEAARLLSVSQGTVYAWIGNGTLASKKVGRVHLVIYASLEALIAGGAQ